MTAHEIATWHNTTVDAVLARIAGSDMPARVADQRVTDHEMHTFGVETDLTRTDEEIALSLVAGDMASERAVAVRRAREADEAERLLAPANERTVYDVDYVNEDGRRGITADYTIGQACKMAETLFTRSGLGRVTEVTIVRTAREVEA